MSPPVESLLLELRAVGTKAELTPIDMAGAIGITRESWYRYESGDRVPNLETFNAICDAYIANLDDYEGSPVGDAYKSVIESVVAKVIPSADFGVMNHRSWLFTALTTAASKAAA